MRVRRAGATVAAIAVAACGGDSKATNTSGGGATAAATPTPAASAAQRVAGARCPHDGRWRLCSVLDRLDKAGLVPRVDTAGPPERLAFFKAPGRVVRLGVGELHTFVYDDTAALARDVAALDTVRVAPRGGTYAWSAAPTFVRSANLVAVLLTPNERQIERVQLALEGGPPGPGSEPPPR